MKLNEFEKKVLKTINKHNMIQFGDCIIVGLSGGADSSALLCSLVSLKEALGLSLIAVHLNHGIRGSEAQRDADFSKELAEKYNVKFICANANVPRYAKSMKISEEMAGRELRYALFNRVLQEYHCSKIAIAHNKNDRAETILLNLIRGSGSNGIEGIKAVNGKIIRPLIDVSRDEIENYASLKNINYVTDSSNAEDIYARNIVRNCIIPQMERINSNSINNIIKCSEIISAESEALSEQITNSGICYFDSDNAYIKKNKFEELNVSLRCKTIMYCITRLCNSTKNITSKQVKQAAENTKTGKITLLGNGYCIINNSTQIIITDNVRQCPDYEYRITVPSVINIEETGYTYAFEFTDSYSKTPNEVYVSADNIEINNLILRNKREGDIFIPSGMTGTKKIKKFFIDEKIPADKRNVYPLLVDDANNVLAVVPIRVSEKYTINEKTNKILKIKIAGGTYD